MEARPTATVARNYLSPTLSCYPSTGTWPLQHCGPVARISRMWHPQQMCMGSQLILLQSAKLVFIFLCQTPFPSRGCQAPPTVLEPVLNRELDIMISVWPGVTLCGNKEEYIYILLHYPFYIYITQYHHFYITCDGEP